MGICKSDTEAHCPKLIEKILKLRIFSDDTGKFNDSVQDINGEVLLVSQFTLYGDCKKGRRPSFDQAMSPSDAKSLYEYFVQSLKVAHPQTQTGQFAANMTVALENDGPVTLLVEL